MKKQIVICDLNIWFALGAGKIVEDEISTCTLVPTWVNLIELGYHPLLIEGSEYFINASRKILENIRNLVNIHPFVYLTKYAKIDFPNTNETPLINVIRELNFFISGETNKIPKVDFYKRFEAQKEMYKEMSIGLNNGLNEMRLILSDKRERDKFLNKSLQEYKLNAMKLWVMDLVKTFSNNQVTDFKNYPWGSLELFMKVTGDFFDTAKLDLEMKIKDNDHNDFLNLVYVKPGFKYWTREKKWINRIKRLGLAEYLFEK